MGYNVEFLEWGGEASLLGLLGTSGLLERPPVLAVTPRAASILGALCPAHVLGTLLLCTPTLPTQTWVYLSALSRRETKALTSLSTCHVCTSGCGRSPVGPLRDRGITTHPYCGPGALGVLKGQSHTHFPGWNIFQQQPLWAERGTQFIWR